MTSNPGGGQEERKDVLFFCMMDEKERDQEDDDGLETETNLLYYVAEVCSQDGVDVGQGMTDIWELTRKKRKTGNVG